MKKNIFSLATPIYHLENKPHLGIVYPAIAADVLARFKRMQGEKVFFLTGVSEYGKKIALSALKNNKSPREWVDKMFAYYELIWDRLEISYNNFIRTTDEKHKKIVEKVLEILKKKDLIYQDIYKGPYCLKCERFYTQRQIKGGHCPYHLKKDLITFEEKCYFFRLAVFQKALLKLIEDEEIKIEPEKSKKKIIKFLSRERLKDVVISRGKIEWAIPLPWDSTQTSAAWFDALSSYLSGFGWKGEIKKGPAYWPLDCRIIGEDTLRFRLLIWLALLLSLEVPLPRLIFVHGFLVIPSLNLDELIETFGAEATRYLLLSLFSFEKGGHISLEKFYNKYEADLVHGYGNLFSRVLSLVKEKRKVKFREIDKDFKEKIEFSWKKYIEMMDNLKFNHATEVFKELIIFCNQCLDKEKPWNFSENEPAHLEKILYNLIETLRHLSLMAMPFMPEKADQVLEFFGVLDEEHKKSLKEASQWAAVKEYKIKKKLKKLFAKL